MHAGGMKNHSEICMQLIIPGWPHGGPSVSPPPYKICPCKLICPKLTQNLLWQIQRHGHIGQNLYHLSNMIQKFVGQSEQNLSNMQMDTKFAMANSAPWAKWTKFVPFVQYDTQNCRAK